jgi:osmoprotectant transport system ATP-binding protein
VGAGAALKRLTLSRVREVEVQSFATAGLRDDIETIRRAARAHGTDEVLLLDDRRRPTRWLRREEVRRGGPGLAVTAHEVGDTVTRDATLRDALDAILTEGGGKVAVTGARGEFLGVVSIETLMSSIQDMLEADREAASAHLAELEARQNVQRFEDEQRAGHLDGAHPAESDQR